MIVSKKLRESAGHHDARCMNRQKTIHDVRPESVPAGREVKQCGCGAWFSLPACHAPRHKSCTAKCAANARQVAIQGRAKNCLECGARFIPRPNQLAKGDGRFCSNRCSLASVRRSPAFLGSRPKAVATFRANYIPKAPEQNPLWAGGPQATTRRRIENGKANAYTREYRKRNPDKAREWALNRRLSDHGKLTYGTIPRLRTLQRDKCAYCHCCIKGRYHVDHIVPISRGGRHEAGNVQLLCQRCNLTKWATDPIEFAQRNGRLL